MLNGQKGLFNLTIFSNMKMYVFHWSHLCIIRVQVDTWSDTVISCVIILQRIPICVCEVCNHSWFSTDSHFLCDNYAVNNNQFVFVKCVTTVGFLLPVHTDNQNVWIVICKINYAMKTAHHTVALWCDPLQYSVIFEEQTLNCQELKI